MTDVRRYWGWVITATTFFHFFANYGFLYSYGQFFVIFQEEFGRGATLTGWLGTIPFGLTYLASPISNALISRYGHKLIAIIGVIVCSISLIVTSFMNSLLPMFFTFSLLYGLGINFVTVSGLNIILQYFPEKNSTRSVTIGLMGCNTGLFAVNPLIYFLNANLGWRNCLRIMAAVVMVTGLGTASTYTSPTSNPTSDKRESKWRHNKEKHNDVNDSMLKQKSYLNLKEKNEGIVEGDRENVEDVDLLGEKENSGLNLRSRNGEPRSMAVLRYPEMWMISCALVVCSTAVSFFYMSLVNFLVSRGFDEETSALVMTALGISQVVGKVMVALVGDYLPFPKIFTLVIADIIGAVLMGSLLAAETLVPIIAIILLSGLLVISFLDTIPHAISHQIFHPNLCLVSWTVITSSMGTGYVVGALLGQSIDRTGSYDAALYVCMAFFLASALLCSLVPLYQVRCAPGRVVVHGSGTKGNCCCCCSGNENNTEETVV